MSSNLRLIFLLVILGAGWGITQPLIKIAVSDGFRHFGLIFWQFVIGAVLLLLVSAWRGRFLKFGAKQVQFYLLIAVIGTLIPNSASFEAARTLPAGVLSILMSTMPLIAFPVALLLGIDRFSLPRLAGLIAGLVGVGFLVLPAASLPDPAMVAMIPLAIVAPMFYAFEGAIVSKWGTAGCDAIDVLLGASIIGAILAAPLAIFSGQWINPLTDWGVPGWALLASSIIHTLAYTTYVWLVGRAGSVFAAQVSYLVTGFGVFWAILILSESYSQWVWLSLGLIFLGLLLVQPRDQ